MQIQQQPTSHNFVSVNCQLPKQPTNGEPSRKYMEDFISTGSDWPATLSVLGLKLHSHLKLFEMEMTDPQCRSSKGSFVCLGE